MLGHENRKGNEIADKMEKTGAQKEELGPDSRVLMSTCTLHNQGGIKN